jgi:adenylate cyclase
MNNMNMAPARLIVAISDEPMTFSLDRETPCRIGRGPQNMIALPSEQVSRNHALVQTDDLGCFFVYDLSSSNGTFLNGRRLTAPAQLRDGDVILIGDFALFFIQGEAPDSARHAGRVAPQKTVFHMASSVVTVLVIDIRDFTGLSHGLGEQRLADVIGTFNREVGAILLGAGAWSVKHIGDAVMAFWVHPPDQHPIHCIFAAFESLLAVNMVASTLQNRFGLAGPVCLGAGVNTGTASIGNMGGEAGADHTALGDTVNKTFRLESSTKELGVDVAFSGEVKEVLTEAADLTDVARACRVRLKGYATPTELYAMNAPSLERLVATLRQRMTDFRQP